MNQFLKDCLTGIDGQSYDIGRALWAIGACAFLGLSIYIALKTSAFSPQDFGVGYGGILGGGGAGIALKSKTEPES